MIVVSHMHYTIAPLDQSHLISHNSRYIMKDREKYFTGAQRSQIVWQILLRTPYDVTRPDKAKQTISTVFMITFISIGQVGVVRLINKNVVEACFPLHEGRHDVNGPQGEKSDRRVSEVRT